MSADEAVKADPAASSRRRGQENGAYAKAGAQAEDLRNRLAQLTRILSLNDVAGLIAHEVSQPLGAMLLHANACQRWLAQDPPCIEKARAAAERIVRDGNRARTVVEAVRGITPCWELDLQPVDLNAAIQGALDIADEQLAAHDVTLVCNYGTLPPVTCDALQIVQVVLNLTVNAVESMADSPLPRALVVSSRIDPAEGVVVEIRDSGTGIDASSENRLFTPLYSTKPGAIGLGLSNCRRIVEAHGGRLWATSNDDRGATFSFSIPLGGPPGVDAG